MSVKGPEDTSGYKFGSTGTYVMLSGFTDYDAEEIIIPSVYNGLPVKKIGFGAFKGNDKLVSVIIPDTVQMIESAAFRDCRRLTKVVAGKQLRNIAEYAFAGCKSLKSITLPSTLHTFGIYSFDGCEEMTELNVLDMNKNGEESKRFVIASHNPNRRVGYIQSSMIYFDSYQMTKYDAGYGVLHGIEDLFNIAEYRLKDDYQLDDYCRHNYETAIMGSIPYVIKNDQYERLASAGELGLIEESKIDRYIELASADKGRCMAYLLDYKQKHFKRRELNFDL